MWRGRLAHRLRLPTRTIRRQKIWLVLGKTREMAKHDNYENAKSTYDGFITYAKWGTIVAAIITAVVVLLLV
jgi:hypothetical protein